MIHKSLAYELEYQKFKFLKHLQIIFFSFILVVVSLFSIKVLISGENDTQQSVTVQDGVTYELNHNDQTATVTNINIDSMEMSDYKSIHSVYNIEYLSKSVNIKIPYSVAVDEKKYTVKKIKSGSISRDMGTEYLIFVNIDLYADADLEDNCFQVPINSFNAPNLKSLNLACFGYYPREYYALNTVEYMKINVPILEELKNTVDSKTNFHNAKFDVDIHPSINISEVNLGYEKDIIVNRENISDKISPKIYLGHALLREGTDYTLKNNNLIGTTSGQNIAIEITGTLVFNSLKSSDITNGIFTGAKTIYVNIIYQEDVTINETNGDVVKEYNGKPWSLDELNIKVKGQTVFPELDYELTSNLSNNSNAGSSQEIEINFIGNYSRTVKRTLKIKPKALAKEDITVVPIEYNDSKTENNIKLKFGETDLIKGTDYDVLSCDDTGFKIQLKGNYEGISGVDYHYNWQVISKILTSDDITVNKRVYDGDPWSTDNLIVKFGETTLVEGTDYTVTLPTSPDAGTRDAFFKFIGNYAGTVKKPLTIDQKKLTESDVTIVPQEYDGTPVTLDEIQVKLNNGTLLEFNKDYDIAYTEISEIGTSQVILVLQGNYNGIVTTSLKIIPKELSNSNVNITPSRKVYDGNRWKDEDIEITFEGNILENGKDYDITKLPENADASAVGEDAIIKFKGKYTGSAKQHLTITPKELNNNNVTIIPKIYDGTPYSSDDLIVQSDGTDLVLGTDYTLNHFDAISSVADQGTVSLEFRGNYSGSTTKPLVISPKNLSASDIEISPNEKEYDEETWKLDDIKVTFNGKELSKESDYTIKLPETSDAGIQDAILWFKGNYSGNDVKKEMNIKPKVLSESDVTISPSEKEYDEFPWDSNNVKVMFGDKELEKDKDYDMELPASPNAGSKEVKINFTGNYKGTVSKEYEISQVRFKNVEIIPDSDTKEYDGTVWSPTFKVIVDGEELSLGNGDFSIEYPDDMVNAGNKEIKFKFLKKFDGEVTKTLRIEKKDSSALDIKIDDKHIFDTETWSPSVIVKDGDKALRLGEDYSMSLSDDMSSTGKKALNLTFKNYYGNYTKDLTIESWGEARKLINPNGEEITNYVNANGETSAEITDFGKIWLYEESNGSGTWYCLDNSKQIFEKGSRFIVKWLSLGDKEYFTELDKLDSNNRDALKSRTKLFTVSVISPEGKLYTQLDNAVDFYVELGGKWTKDKIRAWFLSSGEDEIVSAEFIKFDVKGDNKDYAHLVLKHFSTYLVSEFIDQNEDSQNNSSDSNNENSNQHTNTNGNSSSDGYSNSSSKYSILNTENGENGENNEIKKDPSTNYDVSLGRTQDNNFLIFSFISSLVFPGILFRKRINLAQL